MNYETDESKPQLTLAKNVARSIHKKLGLMVPVLVEDILKNVYGFSVIRIDLSSNISALVEFDNRYIGVNNSHHEHRQRFTLAHELGHFCLQHEIRSFTEYAHTSKTEKPPYEREADAFASEFLIPQKFLTTLKHMSFPEMAKHFNVSEEALGWRLFKGRLN